MYRSVDVFVAPNTGGESFGIVLLEAMASGAPVLASDIDAFRRVLDDGRAGAMFTSEDTSSLAKEAVALLGDAAAPRRSCARADSPSRRGTTGTIVAARDPRGLRDGRRPAAARSREDVRGQALGRFSRFSRGGD